MWGISRSNSIIRWQDYRVSASRLAESNFRYTQAYYNQVRTHLALGKDTPLGRTVQQSGVIVAIPILSGLSLRPDIVFGRDSRIKTLVGDRVTVECRPTIFRRPRDASENMPADTGAIE